jgi:hypothetical protein
MNYLLLALGSESNSLKFSPTNGATTDFPSFLPSFLPSPQHQSKQETRAPKTISCSIMIRIKPHRLMNFLILTTILHMSLAVNSLTVIVHDIIKPRQLISIQPHTDSFINLHIRRTTCINTFICIT